MSFRSGAEETRLGGFFPYKTKKFKTADYLCCCSAPAKRFLATVFCCQLPAEPARLQLSFNVAAANQVCVSAANQVCAAACNLLFFRNPLALNFARFAHKISVAGGGCVCLQSESDLCFCCYLTVSVSAAVRFRPAAAGSRPAARKSRNFSKFLQI
ncbi:hypothetical protein [Methanimicrococcus hongohii]|uniref:hypothetical protein n=1 Tax=Methanimicrococcus hongohii TaxID=3028295 RepID=UPI00292E66E6|nr:hypothetical protein [Methanimicrococcus sp. Hf6]